ncbi:uncharacterized protein LOC141704585 [Apium graveolens]|uniref:uncharacterized protein LOC141704585 n=1 Tax=Apium graveolens TaxID=4045 RepID=UPI003D7ADBB7
MRMVENASEWVLEQLSKASNETLSKLMAVLWGICYARNKNIFEGKIISPAATVNWSLSHVREWSIVQRKRKQQGVSHGRRVQHQVHRWEKPPTGVLKLNVDASVKEGQNFFSIRMVLRDSQGHFIAGKTGKFEGAVQVVEAETTAILEGLLWIKDLTAGPVIMESDSLLYVNALNNNILNWFEVGNMVGQFKEILRARSGVSIIFGRKQVKKVAHVLAKLPCDLNSFVISLSAPSCLLETIMSDIMIQ